MPRAARVIVTRPDRRARCRRASWRRWCRSAEVAPDPGGGAGDRARGLIASSAGSIFLVGEARRLLLGETADPIVAQDPAAAGAKVVNPARRGILVSMRSGALALAFCLPRGRSRTTAGARQAQRTSSESGAGQEGYKGVAPGAQGLPPHPPQLPLKSGPQRVTWSGFQVKDGVPTVFVELTAPPDYHIVEQKGGVVVTLKNTVVPLKNNRRPLRVGAFDTAITDVETRQVGRDTQVDHPRQGRPSLPRTASTSRRRPAAFSSWSSSCPPNSRRAEPEARRGASERAVPARMPAK